jgi:hypothetical protein
MRSGSWVVIRKATGEVLFETFSQAVADAVNRERYDVVPIYDYLVALNKAIREGRAG